MQIMMRMRGGMLLSTIVLIMPLVCKGSPTPACVADSLFNYVTLAGGCYVGNALLSNFGYSVSGNGADLAPSSTDITVTPSVPGNMSRLVFTSTVIWSLIGPDAGQGNNSYNAFLSFTTTALTNEGIRNIALSATGRDQNGGAGKIVETLSNGKQLQVSGFAETLTTLTDPGVPFAAVSSLDVTKKIQLSNGQGQGNEFTEIVQDITVATPEPMSFHLVGLSGMAALLLRKRFRRI